MNYITRNHKFGINDNKAFEIYSDSTCKHLEYTCDYHDMIEIMHENIDFLVNDGLISYRGAWNRRNDLVWYNETVELYEKYGASLKSQKNK